VASKQIQSRIARTESDERVRCMNLPSFARGGGGKKKGGTNAPFGRELKRTTPYAKNCTYNGHQLHGREIARGLTALSMAHILLLD